MPRKPEALAEELLGEHGIREGPVPVEQLVNGLGARLVFESLDPDVSGMLYRDDEEIVIGVNARHSRNRQRFTIAHEIGHLRLHPGQPIRVDKVVRVNLRDSTSSQAVDRQEIEANAFAAALLMPRDLVIRQARRRLRKGKAPSDDELISDLADHFEVSTQAMHFRLVNLAII